MKICLNGCGRTTRGYNKVCEVDKDNRRKYGISCTDREDLLVNQDRSCKICNSPLEFGQTVPSKHTAHVDHCHKTGKVRGILCAHCNHGIGKFFDDKKLLMNAINYLEDNDNEGN